MDSGIGLEIDWPGDGRKLEWHLETPIRQDQPLPRQPRYKVAAREIDLQKENLLDDVSNKLSHRTELVTLFTVRWKLT
jgi:hypothetical protein